MRNMYISIAKKLVSEIEAGKYPIGEPIPTRYELAKRFGVARGTVDRAVSELLRKGMIKSRRRGGSIVTSKSHVLNFAIINGTVEMAARFSSGGIHCRAIPYGMLTERSERERLVGSFDGLIWHQPKSENIEWAWEFAEMLPQVLINRQVDGMNCVSTDHANAIYGITSERLKALGRGCLPIFLQTINDRAVGVAELRFDGFIKACRENETFYESLAMPENFAGKLEMLHGKLDGVDRQRPLLIVSDSRNHTGAVMLWARETGRKWRTETFYSDFDNDFPESVWGLRVTSFLQDYTGLLESAVGGLVDQIKGHGGKFRRLLPPMRREGDT